MKIKNYPVVTYLSDQVTPISKINFPAVTFCTGLMTKLFDGDFMNDNYDGKYGMYKPNTLKLEFYSHGHFKASDAERDFKLYGNTTFFKLLDEIDRNEAKIDDFHLRNLKRLQVVDLITKHGTFARKNFSISTKHFLYSLNEFHKIHTFFYTNLHFEWIAVDPYITEILTDQGLCYSFNIALSEEVLDHNITSTDFFYQQFNTKKLQEVIPRRVITFSKGLLVQADIYNEYYNELVQKDFDGNLVIVHDPYELPASDSSRIRVNRNEDLMILVEPRLYEIDESLVDATPEERNCYLQAEKSLKLFRVYTKVNCEHECLADYILGRCGCVEFYMIRNLTTRICSASEKYCFDAARDNFEMDKGRCRCLQPCNYVKYNFNAVPKRHVWSTQREDEPHYQTSAFLTFNKNTYYQFIRKKQFNEVDFLSFSGGLLGLFAGVSALSIVEVLYWILIYPVKLLCMKRSSLVHPEDQVEVEITKNIIVRYLEESSIHGLGYLFNTNIFETLFWLIAFVFSMNICASLISQTNDKVPESHIIVYDDYMKFSDKVQFPAVSFIPEQIIEDRIQAIVREIESYNVPAPIEQLYDYIKFQKTCYTKIDDKYYKIYRKIKRMNQQIRRESSKLDYFKMQFSSFNGKFQPEFIEMPMINALGYTFNLMDADKLLNLDQISDELKYHRNISMRTGLPVLPPDIYPINMDVIDNFVFILNTKLQTYNQTIMSVCRIPQIAIHSPDLMPVFIELESFIDLQYGLTINVEVQPEIIKTDDDLKNLGTDVRECYFDGENSLKFFKHYTQKNCEIECFTNFTFQHCGCVGRFQPYNENEDVDICYTNNDCANDAISQLVSSDGFSIEGNCSCLPTCNSISYNVNYYSEVNSESDELTIIVKMNTDDIILYRRYQQFTVSDVISYVGGLLGLFAGISMLSIFEAFYFFAVQNAVNLARNVGRR